jgi:hypothetical protein
MSLFEEWLGERNYKAHGSLEISRFRETVQKALNEIIVLRGNIEPTGLPPISEDM